MNAYSENDWSEIYLTDKSGKRYFRTTASPYSKKAEINNIMRKIPHCAFIDAQTAQIIVNGMPNDISDDDLLAQLLS